MKHRRRINKRRYIRFVAGAVLLVVGPMMIPACAYFNTFYNAKRIYGEAEAERAEGGGRIAKDKYGNVVERCSKIVRDHPNSRWVDDAIFLMGKALIRQEEYNSGIRKFTELITNFPESDYVPESYYWLAYASYLKKDDSAAEVYVRRFTELYPKEDIRFEVYFLGGDVSLELEKPEEALAYYSLVAEGAPDREVRDMAIMRSAQLFYDQEDWEQAASYYERVLRKGITSEMRRNISVPLGECYARTGKCEQALKLFNELLAEITLVKNMPPPLLGRAESYVCMDSLATAIAVYRDITKQFPKSQFSAKAYYQIGLIYHEKLDSLQKAQAAYSMVSRESPSYEFAAAGLQKSNSLKRLLELQASAGGEQTDEQAAEQKFLAAEIQLTRLNEFKLAIKNYSAVVDSFPETKVAPKAAFALAWMYERKMGDRERAVEMYRHVVWNYPRTYQASGAIERLVTLGEEDQIDLMQAYIDSALADTTGLAAELSVQASDSALIDTTGIVVIPPEQSIDSPRMDTARFDMQQMIDSAWAEVTRIALQPGGRAAGPAPADTAGIAVMQPEQSIDSARVDTARSVVQPVERAADSVPADTTRFIIKPVQQAADSVPAAPRPDTTSAGADSTKSKGGR